MRKIPAVIAASAACLASLAASAEGRLENPVTSAAASGVGLISGWHCTASMVEIEIDGTQRSLAATGTSRADTATLCGGRINTGFGLLFNWAVLSPGTHTLRAFADGVLFGTSTVTVVSLGGEFLTGKAATVTVTEFPSAGRAVVLEWREALQGFVAREVRNAPAISGTWNGANLERRRNCAASQNNGDRGTYARWDIVQDTVGGTLRIVETTVTGLTCTYSGNHRLVGNRREWVDGVYSCSDGKTGTFTSNDIMVTDTAFSIRLATKLTGSESCDIDAILGGSRF